ncbi:peptidase S1 [Tsukamurella sp. 8F]|uniref:peptidase S1 n=1 Tax=unclassified Tsukamurella TaxID=2633480 RepID=UPI0023B96DBA|nr:MULTISPECIES: peptidase S1 [unclassified Tsukamurella]MDF0530840.1 peptidase S1 [Tsukamurella sp. 8J]MDF0588215.1 peptidase S1 [Tsukamurella sp. 8F]
MHTRPRIAAAVLATAALAAAPTAVASADPVLTAATSTTVSPGASVLTVSSMHGNTADGLACTVGFIGQRSDGTKVGVYAGHCGKVGEKVAFGNRVVGKTIASSAPQLTAQETFVNQNAADWAAFTVDPGSAQLVPGGRAKASSLGKARVGDKVCSDGATSGWRCGTVVQVDGSYIATTIGVQTGDSGGPLIRTADGAALGIASRAASFGNSKTPTGSLYYDLGSALSAIGATLVTG